MPVNVSYLSCLVIIIFFGLVFEPAFAQFEKYQPIVSTPLVTSVHPDQKNPSLDVGTNLRIRVTVFDKFSEIKSANLSYSLAYGKNGSWETIPMELLWGDHRNGIYSGTISNPASLKPTYINYRLSFIDNLGYNNTTTGNYPFSNDDYDKEAPLIETISPSPPSPLNSEQKDSDGTHIVNIDTPTTIQASLTDQGTGVKNATLYYSTKNINESTSMNPTDPKAIWDGEWRGNIDTSGIPPNSTVKYFIRAFDYAGNCNCSKIIFKYKTENIKMNTIDIHAEILDADTSNLTTKIQTSINEHSWPEDKATSYEGIVFGDNNYKPFDHELIPNKKQIQEAKLRGNPSNYPFDSYKATMIIAIPNNTDIVINEGISPEIDTVLKASWDIPPPAVSRISPSSVEYLCTGQINVNKMFVCPSSLVPDHNNVTFAQIDILFKRNYTILGIIIPILAIFFLLGATFIFETKSDHLSDRLTLTLGVFALIFSLPEIIKLQKPVSIGPSVADSLLSVIVVATIAYTIGSVIGSKLEGRERLQKWIDKMVYVFMIIIVIAFFGFYQYPLETSLWIGALILFGLGFGLLFQTFIKSLKSKSSQHMNNESENTK